MCILSLWPLAEDENLEVLVMEVRNCRKCGRIFNYVVGMPICPACRERIEEKFQEVKEYIRENKGAGIPEISKVCEVETSQIHQWIREERLVFADDSPIGINCENCNATIKTGRFCERCKATMVNNLKSSIQKPKVQPVVHKDTKENPRMRYLDR